MVNQDLTHGPSGRPEQEVSVRSPVEDVLAQHPHHGLVHDGGRRQGVARRSFRIIRAATLRNSW